MYSEKPFNVCKSKRFQIMFDMQILIALVCIEAVAFSVLLRNLFSHDRGT